MSCLEQSNQVKTGDQLCNNTSPYEVCECSVGKQFDWQNGRFGWHNARIDWHNGRWLRSSIPIHTIRWSFGAKKLK